MITIITPRTTASVYFQPVENLYCYYLNRRPIDGTGSEGAYWAGRVYAVGAQDMTAEFMTALGNSGELQYIVSSWFESELGRAPTISEGVNYFSMIISQGYAYSYNNFLNYALTKKIAETQAAAETPAPERPPEETEIVPGAIVNAVETTITDPERLVIEPQAKKAGISPVWYAAAAAVLSQLL